MKRREVAVVCIEHKHGTNVYACVDGEAATAVVAQYAREWWPSDEDMPSTDAELIEEYFELCAAEESYFVEHVEIEGRRRGVVRWWTAQLRRRRQREQVT